MPNETLTAFEQKGFSLISAAVPQSELERLTGVVEQLRDDRSLPGLRNILSRSAEIRGFATCDIVLSLVKNILGCTPQPVRAILFDKTPDSNWYVTWHQDVSIPVKTRIEMDGYGPWSIKDEILHVQPPAAILERMVSLRIHLDACTENNGAIKFISGSHRAGILDSEQIGQWRHNHEHTICPANRGDIIAMRPLIIHSSSKSQTPEHRRVLHLEYAGVDLPSGLEWAEA